MAKIMAKPTRSAGEKVVPSMRTVVMVAVMGSMVPRRLARMEPVS